MSILFQERIDCMTEEQCKQLLKETVDREPSLIFSLIGVAPDEALPTPPAPPEPPAALLPTWCRCGNCREMTTLLERKCCGHQPENCTSKMPYMDLYILDANVLRLARRIWNDLRAEPEFHEDGEGNKQFRYAAYRNFVVWQYGVLGPRTRVVIPSCCVWRIRDKYPDPSGNYVGFIPVGE